MDSINSFGSSEYTSRNNDDSMNIDSNSYSSPKAVIVKKSSMSFEERMMQITGDAEDLRKMVSDYLKTNKLVVQQASVRMINLLPTNSGNNASYTIIGKQSGNINWMT